MLFLCSALFGRKESDLLAYTPPGARSRAEYQAYQDFFDNKGQGITIYLLVTAKDNGTLTRTAHLREIVRVLDHVNTNFTMHNANSGQNETFPEFCRGFCQINEPVRQFYVSIFILQVRCWPNV